MFSVSRFDRHIGLMHRMGDALGVDPETEILSGRLSPETYRERVFRCVACAHAETCEALLDAVGGDLDTAPDYCRNKADFDASAR